MSEKKDLKNSLANLIKQAREEKVASYEEINSMLSKDFSTEKIDQLIKNDPDKNPKGWFTYHKDEGEGDYYTANIIKTGFDNFHDLLDFVYVDDDVKKQAAIKKLKDKLIQVRSDSGRFRRP